MTSPVQMIGSTRQEVRDVVRDGKPARAVIASRSYPTDIADLWDALTTAERISRWLAPVSGDLRLGGRYQIQGNAGGEILACEPPRRLEVSWTGPGPDTWVTVTLTPEAAGARLTLEHVAPVGDDDSFWVQYGPGAVGVGWDLSFLGLALHVADPTAPRQDPEAWVARPENKAIIRASSEAWRDASIAFGTELQAAREAGERTTAFYTGG